MMCIIQILANFAHLEFLLKFHFNGVTRSPFIDCVLWLQFEINDTNCTYSIAKVGQANNFGKPKTPKHFWLSKLAKNWNPDS